LKESIIETYCVQLKRFAINPENQHLKRKVDALIENLSKTCNLEEAALFLKKANHYSSISCTTFPAVNSLNKIIKPILDHLTIIEQMQSKAKGRLKELDSPPIISPLVDLLSQITENNLCTLTHRAASLFNAILDPELPAALKKLAARPGKKFTFTVKSGSFTSFITHDTTFIDCQKLIDRVSVAINEQNQLEKSDSHWDLLNTLLQSGMEIYKQLYIAEHPTSPCVML